MRSVHGYLLVGGFGLSELVFGLVLEVELFNSTVWHGGEGLERSQC